MFCVISRSVAGWMSRSFSCATWKRRRIATGSLVKASGDGDGQALAVEPEAFELARPQRLPQRGELGLAAAAVLERGHEDAREVAHRLGVKIVVLGEAFDAAAARAVPVAEACGDLALQVERQAIVGAARQIVDVAAHRREETLGALEVSRLFLA